MMAPSTGDRGGSSGAKPAVLGNDGGGEGSLRDLWISTCLGCGTFGLYVFLVFYLDNTNLVTTNGLWKLPGVQRWEHFNVGSVDPSNFLYFPVTGLGITALPRTLFGEGWVRLSVINAGWASLAVVGVYGISRGIGLPRVAAIAASLAQTGFAFFLALGVTSEDIMGGYTLLCGAAWVAILAARHSGAKALFGWAAAGALFACSFLWEWRLLFPSAPALGLAILVTNGGVRSRLWRFGAWLFGLVITVAAGAVLWMVFAPVGRGFVARMATLFWTAKATQSGWAGWSTAKLQFLLLGITQYPIGGKNISTLHTHALVDPRTYIVGVIVLLLFVALLLWGAQNRTSSAARVGVVLLAVTFLTGCVMNLWSQPQDPQMQINVMMFLPVSVGVAVELLRVGIRRRPGALPGAQGETLRAIVARGVAWLLGPVLVVVNVWGDGGYAASRGEDERYIKRVKSLFASTDLSHTVYVFQGFDGELTWMDAIVGFDGGADWPPTPSPRVKLIGMASMPVAQPDLTAPATADYIIGQIDAAWSSGYRILAGPFWSKTREEFVGSLRVVADEEKATAIYDRLRSKFCADPVAIPLWPTMFFELTPSALDSRVIQRQQEVAGDAASHHQRGNTGRCLRR
jgi:hypothetical protein